MNRPDPGRSKIQDIFNETFSNMTNEGELEDLKNQGELLFQPEDISETSWILDVMLRKFCVDNKITEPYFAEKYKIYALKELGFHPTQASNNRSNLMKALKAGNITFKRFVEVACHILGWDIDNLTFQLSSPEGKQQELSFIDKPK